VCDDRTLEEITLSNLATASSTTLLAGTVASSQRPSGPSQRPLANPTMALVVAWGPGGGGNGGTNNTTSSGKGGRGKRGKGNNRGGNGAQTSSGGSGSSSQTPSTPSQGPSMQWPSFYNPWAGTIQMWPGPGPSNASPALAGVLGSAPPQQLALVAQLQALQAAQAQQQALHPVQHSLYGPLAPQYYFGALSTSSGAAPWFPATSQRHPLVLGSTIPRFDLQHHDSPAASSDRLVF
jgi:hypothetical protein